MSRFRCLAGECEATCCGGGAVPVEPAAHRRLTLLAAGDPSARDLLAAGVELTPEGPGFARLRFLPSGDCSMLDGTGLCRVQAKFGHAALFDVCATYPRYASEINDDLELFGTLSCPEVARLALLSDDGFVEEDVSADVIPRKLRNRFRTEQPYYRPYRQVRASLVRLLCEPGFLLSEKLFVALWLAEQLRPVLHADCGPVPNHDLDAVLGALAAHGVLDALVANFRGLHLAGEWPLEVIWQALPPPAHSRPGAQTWRFDEILREVWADHGRSPGAFDAAGGEEAQRQLWATHVRLRTAVPEAVRQRIETCLSRYVVNHVLTTPYMLSANLFVYVYELVVRVAALRFLLHSRLSGFPGAPAEVDRVIVEVTYGFVRAIEHTELLGHVQRRLEAQGLDRLPHALCFLAI